MELRGDLDQPVVLITKAPHRNQAEQGGALGANNGGRGARVKGSVRLQKGTQLRVLVGQEATGGGGGGGML